MSDLNKVFLKGTLGGDAELRYGNSGVAVLKWSMAVRKSKKNGNQWTDTTLWFNCVMFGKRAEFFSQVLVKGTLITLEGELHQSTWQDRDSGQPRSAIQVFVNNLDPVQRIIRNNSQGGQQQGNTQGRGNNGNGNRQQNRQPQYTTVRHDDGFEDDIPF